MGINVINVLHARPSNLKLVRPGQCVVRVKYAIGNIFDVNVPVV